MDALRIWFKSYYDKWIALLVILGLIYSLGYIGYRASTLQTEQSRFETEQRQLQPTYPTAAPPDTAVFEEGAQRRQDPFQMSDWTNKMMTPELRVSCVHCDRPIPWASTNCPFCHASQPMEVVDNDSDNDGMPDDWEKQYKLNPLDPTDATADEDGDGFTNLEEYKAHTDPSSPQSHPLFSTKLHVKAFRPIPFNLTFKAVTKLNGHTLFQLNLTDRGSTLFLELGENTDKKHPSEGFLLKDFKTEPDPRHPNNRDADMQILTLQKGDKMIRLIKGQSTPWNEFEITLFFDLENREIKVRTGSEFELRNEKYRVKEIDTKAQRVLLEDRETGKEIWIER